MLDLALIAAGLRTFAAVTDYFSSRNQLQASELQLQALKLQQRLAQQSTSQDDMPRTAYPLGHPGRVRSMSVRDGLVPQVLICPSLESAVSEPLTRHRRQLESHVAELAADLDPAERFLQVVRDAFVADGAQIRAVEGQISAEEISRNEFAPGPSLVIYRSPIEGGFRADACVSHLIGTVDGSSLFQLPVVEVIGSQMLIPRWHVEDDGAIAYDWSPVTMAGSAPVGLADLSTALAAFCVALASIHWHNMGVSWRIGADNSSALIGMLKLGTDELDDPQDQMARIERELLDLRSRQLDVTFVNLDDGQCGIQVNGPVEVLFFLDADYPHSPPEILEMNAGDELIAVALDHWDPTHSLADLYQAFST